MWRHTSQLLGSFLCLGGRGKSDTKNVILDLEMLLEIANARTLIFNLDLNEMYFAYSIALDETMITLSTKESQFLQNKKY